ncbi:hypothetical protein E7T06_07965 [Deinococcus sp. Arct2-2]|uniref:hypothetical protein n=1 Tax=Deinococcus sp. Arct2-2 TaxID=2568653 RepID=UPI0010A48446|nr:hypothetical protein [Deinococcus sp. Arct2-2]THF70390.1 hypothetical protein E7T06_07965 [Deinococcus sp. Arct2-2]
MAAHAPANDPNAAGQWIRRLVRRQQPVRAFESCGFTWVDVDDVAEATVRAAEKDGNEGEQTVDWPVGDVMVLGRGAWRVQGAEWKRVNP